MTEGILKFDKDKTILHAGDLLSDENFDAVEISPFIQFIEEGTFAHGKKKLNILIENNPHFVYDHGFLTDKRDYKLLHYNGDETIIQVPSYIERIGSWAFYECAADQIVFKREIDEIHEDAFTTCLLKEAVFAFEDAHVFFPQRDIRLRQYMLEGFGLEARMFAFERYDESLLAGYIEPERMREIAARLKWPYALNEEIKVRFRNILELNCLGAVEELGRAEDLEALTWLCDLEIIDQSNVDMALAVLHDLKDLKPYVYLSRYRREHWPDENFDFSL